MQLGSPAYRRLDGPVGPTAIAPLPASAEAPDVHLLLMGGGTPGNQAMAPLAEVLRKPCLGVNAAGDSLSDKVGLSPYWALADVSHEFACALSV